MGNEMQRPGAWNAELSDEQLDELAGGVNEKSGTGGRCPDGQPHKYERTGEQRPGSVFGKLWPDHQYRCSRCGDITWKWS